MSNLKSNRLNIKFVGRVIYGNGLGRRLGFPTANIETRGETKGMREGVYAGFTVVDGRTYRSVINIGRSPSVITDGAVRIETHLIDFDGNLYGREVRVELCAFLREERKFSSLDELKARISYDKAEAEKILAQL